MTSLQLFSPEKVLNAMNLMRTGDCDLEEKTSPMDVSSPDSHKSFGELTQSLGTFSLSEESVTFVAEPRRQPEEEDSLDEISSGEMSSGSLGNSSHISHNVSEFWDEVRHS